MLKHSPAPGVLFSGTSELDGYPMDFTAWPDGRVLVSFGVTSLHLSAEAAAALANDLLTVVHAVAQSKGGGL